MPLGSNEKSHELISSLLKELEFLHAAVRGETEAWNISVEVTAVVQHVRK